MPTSDEILRGLATIASTYWPVSLGWHVAVGLALLALATGRWRPSRRAGAALLALPAVSVSVLAWATGNPFNGATFVVIAGALALAGARLPREPVEPGPTWATALGAAVLAYAWVYPHFLESFPAWAYLYAAPLGAVPCPTLSAVLGFGLLAGGFGSRGWIVTAGVAGLFYAVFGMLRLGVWLDAGLLLAALATLALAIRAPSRSSTLREREGAA